MSPRAHNYGVRKTCDCPRSRWPKCPHAWCFNFKPAGGPSYRFSLDVELGRHVETKTEAQAEATRIRAAILAGTFQRQPKEAQSPPAPASGSSRVPVLITLERYVAIFVDRVSKASGKTTWPEDKQKFGIVCAHRGADGRPLGEWPLVSITEDELEAFYTAFTTAGRAANTRNHYVTLFKKAFKWAVRKGYLARSPISEESALKRSKGTQRRRRIPPTEETALLAAAGDVTHGAAVRLQWLIVAAIETGCRSGELLAVQWADVDRAKRTMLIRAVEAGARKTGTARELPVSTRLAAILEMARLDPAGREYPSTAYVFGQLGARVRSVKKAWETCVLRAHGHPPTWDAKGKLTASARAALDVIDLHFHDLRHEAGCRWLEAGWRFTTCSRCSGTRAWRRRRRTCTRTKPGSETRCVGSIRARARRRRNRRCSRLQARAV
jgi:integrase